MEKKLSNEELVKTYKQELRNFYKRRKTLIWLAFLALVVGIAVFAVGTYFKIPAVIVIGAIVASQFIMLLILRSKLYNRRIKSRIIALKNMGIKYNKYE